jgi:hypothetical protein
MIPLVGDVLYDDSYLFTDGQIGKKLFIILADVDDDTNNVYVARCTSKEKSPRVEMCHLDGFEPTYFLEAGETFPKDTWVQFDQVVIFSFDKAETLKKSFTKKKQLSMQTMHKILLCASQSQYIDGYAEAALIKQSDIFS